MQPTNESGNCLRLTTPGECWSDAFSSEQMSVASSNSKSIGALPELNHLEEQGERLVRLRKSVAQLCLQMTHGDVLLREEEIMLQKLKHLQQDEEMKSYVAEVEVDNTIEECLKRNSLRQRLAEQLKWLQSRNRWLGQLQKWLNALIEVIKDKVQLNEIRLNELDDWFTQLRIDAASPLYNDYEMYSKLASTYTSKYSELNEVADESLSLRQRVINSPYVLQWLCDALGQGEKSAATLSTNSCSTIASVTSSISRMDLGALPSSTESRYFQHISDMTSRQSTLCRQTQRTRSLSENNSEQSILSTSIQRSAFESREESDIEVYSSAASHTSGSLSHLASQYNLRQYRHILPPLRAVSRRARLFGLFKSNHKISHL